MSRRHHQGNHHSVRQPATTLAHTLEHMPDPTNHPPSIFQRGLVWLFHVLLITTPLFFAFSTDELFEFNKMMLTYCLTVLITGVWLGRMVFEKRLIWRHTKLDYFIGLFLLSQLISTLFSIHPYTSWLGYYSRFHGGLASSITYALLYWAFVSNITRRDLRGLTLSTMLAGSVVSLYAIGEHFGHSFSCFMTSGGTSFGVDCWVQDVQHRVFATFGQPNWLAAYALMLLSMLVGVLMSSWPSRWERWCYYGCYLLLFWTLLYTGSRSGFLGFVAALLVVGVGMGIFWWLERDQVLSEKKKAGAVTSYSPASSVRAVGIIAGITLLASVLSGTPYSPSIGDILSRSTTAPNAVEADAATPVAPADQPVVNRLDIGGTDSGEIRKIVWQGALDVWRRYPLIGSGVETFAYSYYQDRPVAHNLVSEWDFLYNKAHNEFLNFLATTGAVGLGTYLALLGSYLVLALLGFIKLIQKKAPDRALAVLGLAGAVVGLSVSNFFGFSTVMVTILQYLAFATTMLLILEPSREPKPVREISIWQLAILVLIIVGALFPLTTIFSHYRADQLYTSAQSLMSQGQIQPAGINLTRAIKLSPREALFWDELAQLYAQAAVSYAQTGVATDVGQLAAEAVAMSDRAMALNNRQLNLYKTRARIFIILSQLDEKYLEQAIKTLEAATVLSPTDPKLLYNLALLKLQRGDTAAGTALLTKAVELKPNYVAASMELSNQLWGSGKKQEAIDRLETLIMYEPTIEQLRTQLASYSAQLQSE